MDKLKLTIERLNLEYLQWIVQYPDSKNNEDLRFGQYISNKYSYDCEEDVFYNVSTNLTYNILLDALQLNNVENIL